uniref:Uncharacterized protein n=1 Tax=Oryza punctata TaxID=4537 RepID=A0A0E0KZG3_ORYPU
MSAARVGHLGPARRDLEVVGGGVATKRLVVVASTLAWRGSLQGSFGSGKGASSGGLSSSMTVGILSFPGVPPLTYGDFLGWVEAAACQRGKLRLLKRCHPVPVSPSAKSGKEAGGWRNRGTWANSQGWWSAASSIHSSMCPIISSRSWSTSPLSIQRVDSPADVDDGMGKRRPNVTPSMAGNQNQSLFHEAQAAASPALNNNL